jgi:hypothetical protein
MIRGVLLALGLCLAGLAFAGAPLAEGGFDDEPLQQSIRLSARAAGLFMILLFGCTGRHARPAFLARASAALAVAFAVCHLAHLGLLVTRLVRYSEAFMADAQVLPAFLGGMVYALVPWVGWRGLRALPAGVLRTEGALALALHVIFGAIVLGFATRAGSSPLHLALTVLAAVALISRHGPRRSPSADRPGDGA